MQVINTPISPYVQNAPIAYCEETQKCIFIDPGDDCLLYTSDAADD